MDNIELTPKHYDLMAHSLGINLYHSKMSSYHKDKLLPEKFYRNYFASSTGSEDFNILRELESMGLTESWLRWEYVYFKVSIKGIELFINYFLEEVTSKFVPPKKSKMRYESYLEADTGDSFCEYLNIELPRIECNKDGNYRYASTKYSNVKGGFRKTKKLAKTSYKQALTEYKILNK